MAVKKLSRFWPKAFFLTVLVRGRRSSPAGGIFQDLVRGELRQEMNLSKTQLRSALRLYTSSWRYLYGVVAGRNARRQQWQSVRRAGRITCRTCA
ncbi:hypothetical protein KCP73_00540 [Salmonella enterica subsp. enterica]|nr:hypothetical protein KCP73_00540 [Salmonella enterica subsp. enterica]